MALIFHRAAEICTISTRRLAGRPQPPPPIQTVGGKRSDYALPSGHIVGRSGHAILPHAEDRRAPAFERFRDTTAGDDNLVHISGIQNDVIAMTPGIEDLESDGIQSVISRPVGCGAGKPLRGMDEWHVVKKRFR